LHCFSWTRREDVGERGEFTVYSTATERERLRFVRQAQWKRGEDHHSVAASTAPEERKRVQREATRLHEEVPSLSEWRRHPKCDCES
jgi:hypothetical protein